MNSVNSDEYSPILIESLRVDFIIPFTCYVHLPAQGRMFIFISSSHAFTEEKAHKLKKVGYNELYIKKSEKLAYHSFLESFFSSPSGQDLFEELKGKQQNGEDIPGLPTLEELPLSELMTPAQAVPQEIEEQMGAITQEEEQEVGSLLNQLDSLNEEDEENGDLDERDQEEYLHEISGRVLAEEEVEQISHASNEEKELLKLLNQSSKNIVESMQVRGDLTPEEKTTLQNCTDVIEDILVKVQGGPFDNPDEYKQVVAGSLATMTEQIQRVEGISSQKNDLTQKYLAEFAAGIQHSITAVTSATDNAGEDLSEEDLKEETQLTGLEVKKLRDLLSSEAVQVAQRTLDDIREQYQDHQGFDRLEVNSDPLEDVQNEELGDKEKEWEEQKEKLEMQVSELNTQLGDYKELYEKSQESVAEQEAIISSLSDELTQSQDLVADLRENWESYRGKTQFHADQKTKLKAKNLDLLIDEFERTHESVEQDVKRLETLGDKLVDEFDIDQEVLESEKEKEAENRKAAKEEAQAEEQPESVEENVEEDTGKESKVPKRQTAASSDEETELLRVQLENAQALLESNDTKIQELQALLEKNNSYSKGLEDDVNQKQDRITHLEDRLDSVEEKKSRFEEALRESDRVMNRDRAELEERESKVIELRQRLGLVEEELEALKRTAIDATPEGETLEKGMVQLPREVAAVVSEKDEYLKGLQRKYERANESLKHIKKQNINLEANLTEKANNLKAISEKLERARNDYQEARSNERSMQIQVSVTQQSLDQSRKSIEKLTTLTTELKKDRTEYMEKTNEALENLKSTLQRATRMSQRIDTEKARSQRLAKEIQRLAASEKALKAELAKESRKVYEISKQVQIQQTDIEESDGKEKDVA